MEKMNVTKDLKNNTLIFERSFNASKEKLWAAYTEKDLFEKWWGPVGWETSAKEFNFVPAGRIHYGMKCVDQDQKEWYGQESWGMMLIETVDAGNSFTYKDYFADAEGALKVDMPVLMITNQFTDEDGRAKIISTSTATSAEQIEELIKMGMLEGFDSQLGKLDRLLTEEQE